MKTFLILLLMPLMAFAARPGTQYFDFTNYDFGAGPISGTELFYVDGATSNLQTQIDNKVNDTAYDDPSWDGVTAIAPSKNSVRDQIESMLAVTAGLVSDTAYSSTSWDGVTTVAPSKNSVRDQIETIITSVSLKSPSESPTFTGSVTVPAPSNSTDASTKGYVDTNNALNVQLAGSQTITGAKTFSAQMVATSTTFGNRTCPVMSDAQMLAISGASQGDCVYNSTKKSPYFYDSTTSLWKAAGGGAGGGSRLNLMIDGSFEDAITDGSCSGCTASQETTSILSTPNNTKALKLAFSASTGCYTVDKSTSGQFASVQGLVGVWIKNTNAGIVLTSRRDGSDTTNTRNIDSDGVYRYYDIPEITGSTSFGWKICATSSITGDVYLDEVFTGPSSVLGIAPVITAWQSYTPTFTGFGTVTGVNCSYRQVAQNYEIRCNWTNGTVTPTEARVSLPNGLASSSNIPSVSIVGTMGSSVSSAVTYYVLAEPSTSYLTFSIQGPALSKLNGSILSNNSNTISMLASIPIASLAGSVNTYSSSCGAGCESSYSAKISNAGVVSSENVDWLNGNCSLSVSTFTCNLNAGLNTSALNCSISINEAAGAISPVLTYTSPSVITVLTQNAAAVNATRAFTLHCQKQSSDFIASRTITGSFKNVVTSTNVTSPKVCSWDFSSAGVISNNLGCSPTMTYAGGSADFTFPANTWTSKPNCTCTTRDNSGGCSESSTSEPSVTNYGFLTRSTANTTTNTGGFVICHGQGL